MKHTLRPAPRYVDGQLDAVIEDEKHEMKSRR